VKLYIALTHFFQINKINTKVFKILLRKLINVLCAQPFYNAFRCEPYFDFVVCGNGHDFISIGRESGVGYAAGMNKISFEKKNLILL